VCAAAEALLVQQYLLTRTKVGGGQSRSEVKGGSVLEGCATLINAPTHTHEGQAALGSSARSGGVGVEGGSAKSNNVPAVTTGVGGAQREATTKQQCNKPLTAAGVCVCV
jgi:hypothetical protein